MNKEDGGTQDNHSTAYHPILSSNTPSASTQAQARRQRVPRNKRNNKKSPEKIALQGLAKQNDNEISEHFFFFLSLSLFFSKAKAICTSFKMLLK